MSPIARDDIQPPSAATRLGTNRDILHHVASFLDPTVLRPWMTTSTTFNLVAVPRLYYTLDVAKRVICQNDKAVAYQINPFFARTENFSPFDKTASLKHVKELHLFEHTTETCISKSISVPVLDNLQILHLDGGGRPKEDYDKEICSPQTCPLVLRACSQAKIVINRSIGDQSQGQLPLLPKLEQVVLKFRPCQIPGPHLYDGERMPPYESVKSPFGTLSSAKQLDIVFWDEQHEYRVDETYSEGWYNYGGSPICVGPHKDCFYCNVRSGGCGTNLRRFHAEHDLTELMNDIGRWTEVTRLRIYNVDRTTRKHHIHPRHGLPVDEIKRRMFCSIANGRKKRDEEAGNKVEVTFHTTEDYVVDLGHTIDDRERGYWDLLTRPSDMIRNLRDELVAYPGFYLDLIDIEPWGEDQLRRELEKITEREEQWRRNQGGDFSDSDSTESSDLSGSGSEDESSGSVR